jgi:hypothetical protein
VWSSSPVSSAPRISPGPRSLPACGSIAHTRAASPAPSASTIADRPRKLPISTIVASSRASLAACHSRRS